MKAERIHYQTVKKSVEVQCLDHVILDSLFNFSVNLFPSLENRDNKTCKNFNACTALRTMPGIYNDLNKSDLKYKVWPLF